MKSLNSFILALLIHFLPVHGELVLFETIQREPFANGKTFGKRGAYEIIHGRMKFEIDPNKKQNLTVIDIDKVPLNHNHKIECSADYFILAPKDLSQCNGSLLYDVNNRGNKNALGYFNLAMNSNFPSKPEHAGDGLLMEQGYVIAWSGWDGELLPGNHRLRLGAPVAQEKNGKAITGMVRCEMTPSKNTKKIAINWNNHGSFRPTSTDFEGATLTHRLRPMDPRVLIPSSKWSLQLEEVESDLPGQLPKITLSFPEGMKSQHIYELIYPAQQPNVMGLGFATVRDFISSIKYGTGKQHPLLIDQQPVVNRTYKFGVSQSGRFIREFLYWGFNEDEKNRQVFNAVIPHVSGSGMGSFNHRFAQPTRHAAQHDHHDYPPDRFPFSYSHQYDPLTQQNDGILDRSIASNTVPIVLHTQSSSEYWSRSGSLTHTDPLGKKDVVLPESVYIYIFGGTQHGPSRFPPSRGSHHFSNPGNFRPFLRSLILSLDSYFLKGKPLPKSVYPTINKGTLVDWDQKSSSFPVLPNVIYPGTIQQPAFFNYGPRWFSKRIIDNQPPIYKGDYKVLVPKYDQDGMEMGCLQPPEVAVPIATYTGWNVKKKSSTGTQNELSSLQGSYIPFPQTKQARIDTKDPRRSLEERYENISDYEHQLKAYCLKLAKNGYLLKADIPQIIETHTKRASQVLPKEH